MKYSRDELLEAALILLEHAENTASKRQYDFPVGTGGSTLHITTIDTNAISVVFRDAQGSILANEIVPAGSKHHEEFRVLLKQKSEDYRNENLAEFVGVAQNLKARKQMPSLPQTAKQHFGEH